MFIVQRSINNITLNGKETLLDSEGNTMIFQSYDGAKAFLLEKLGVSIVTLEQALDNGEIEINQVEEV